MSLIYVFYIRLLHGKRTCEHFLGLEAHAFNYTDIFFLFAEIFFRGEYAFSSKETKPAILDCGANIGFATLFFKWRYPESSIDAFEPDPATFALLEKNIQVNKLQNVRLHNYALAVTNGETVFYIDPKHPGSAMMSSNASRGDFTPITVKASTLEPYLKEPVDFLKMDVEGAEVELMKNIDELSLFSHIGGEMAIEYHHHVGNAPSALSDFLGILEKNGFSYQMNARAIPTCEDQFQDINIFAFRR